MRSTRWAMLVGVLAAGWLASTPGAARAQVTTGLALTKTCPSTATTAAPIVCTITVENKNPNDTASGLTITNQVPYPDGAVNSVAGCATSLGSADMNPGSGPDFTSCTVTEPPPDPCDGNFVVLADQARAAAVYDTSKLTTSASTTNAVIVFCNGMPPPPQKAPTASGLGLALFAAALLTGGALRLRRRQS
jgi:hypothetical protein